MTDQLVVEFDGVRLTRLPAGRAEGFVWLTFVGAGSSLRLAAGDPLGWRIEEHVSARWASGEKAHTVERHASSSDGMSSFSAVIRDTGEASIVLTYVGSETILTEEVVTIPT